MCTVSKAKYMESEPQACILSSGFFFSRQLGMLSANHQATFGFSKLLNILKAPAFYCFPLTKPYYPNYKCITTISYAVEVG